MASTRLWYLAIKKESTTALAVKPTHFLRFKEWDIMVKKDIIQDNPIQNNRWNSIVAVPWKTTTDWSYKMDLDPNECWHFFQYALWALATTDVWSTPAQVYQHIFTIANTLPSFTLEQWKGNLTDTWNNYQNYQVDRAYWVMVDKITMAWSDGIISCDVDLKAHWVFQRSLLTADVTAWSSVSLYLESASWLVATDTIITYDNTPQSESDAVATVDFATNIITIATLANSYTVAKLAKVELAPASPITYGTPKIMNFSNCNFQFGTDLTAAASATEENIENWTFEYMNNLEERFGSLRSSPSVIAPKWAWATLKFTKYFESVIDRDRYLAQTKKAWILTISNNEKIWAGDTGNKKYTVKIEMSDLRFTSYEMPTWTDELYAINCECACFYDSSDARAVRITVINGTAGTIYTA